MLNVSPLPVLALVTLMAAGWALHVERLDGQHKAEVIGGLQDAAKRDGELIAAQAAAIGGLEELREQIRTIGEESRQLRGVLDLQASQLRAGLEELKRNDQEARDYLAGAVPAAVGVRYARPATTDPAAYRAAAAGLQPDPVSAARPRPAAGK